jgi:hypothetical protein
MHHDYDDDTKLARAVGTVAVIAAILAILVGVVLLSVVLGEVEVFFF